MFQPCRKIHRYSLLFLYGFLLCISACTNSQKELDRFINKKQLAVEEARDVESFLSQGGEVRARLTAPVMIRYTQDSIRVEFPKTLVTEFYVDREKLRLAGMPDTFNYVESRIRSLYGVYTEFNSKVYLRDSVLCVNLVKHDTLWADELWWDQNAKVIYTETYYHLKTRDGQDLTGAGLRASQTLDWYELKKGKGAMQAPQGSMPY